MQNYRQQLRVANKFATDSMKAWGWACLQIERKDGLNSENCKRGLVEILKIIFVLNNKNKIM